MEEREQASWRAAHGVVLLLGFLAPAGFPQLALWPLYLLAPLLLYGLAVLLIAPLRRSCVWFRIGVWRPWLPALTALVMLLSATALVVYQAQFHPDVADLASKIPVRALGGPLLGSVIFAVVNALLEELIFRGVLYDALESQWGWQAALLLTSAAFGFAHAGGNPPGPLGAVLAGVHGLMLGGLRRLSGGLAFPLAAHIVADAVIFAIFVWEGTVAPG